MRLRIVLVFKLQSKHKVGCFAVVVREALDHPAGSSAWRTLTPPRRGGGGLGLCAYSPLHYAHVYTLNGGIHTRKYCCVWRYQKPTTITDVKSLREMLFLEPLVVKLMSRFGQSCRDPQERWSRGFAAEGLHKEFQKAFNFKPHRLARRLQEHLKRS